MDKQIYQGVAYDNSIIKGYLTEKDGKMYIFSIEVKPETVVKL